MIKTEIAVGKINTDDFLNGLDYSLSAILDDIQSAGARIIDIKYQSVFEPRINCVVGSAMIIYEMPETNRQITETSCEERL